MTEKSKVIFGNKISDKDYKSAIKAKKGYIKKYGDDSATDYKIRVTDNKVIGSLLGVKNVEVTAKIQSSEGAMDTEKGIIVGNIRMGFGHYRISMAMASAARSMGYVPYWMDLNGYPQTTCTKVISAQNDLYSLGSRLSKNPIFNKFIWEPMNYEGFRKLSYNSSDQKNAELMATNDSITGAVITQIPAETFRMAVVVIITIPVIITYPLIRKHVAPGIMAGAIKY